MIINPYSFGGLDPNAEAFLATYGIADPVISGAINVFVLGCKSNDVWGDIDVILPIVGGTASSHRGCLKTATNKVTWNGGITHDSTGVLFNGTNGYGNVDWNAPNLYNRTAIEWTTDIIGGDNNWSGMYSGGIFGMQLQKSGANINTVALGLNTLAAVGVLSTMGLKASVVESSASNGGKHYGNSGLLTQATAGSVPTGINYFIGAVNSSGTASLFNKRRQSFYIFGNAFDASKIAIIKTLIQDFQTTLGR